MFYTLKLDNIETDYLNEETIEIDSTFYFTIEIEGYHEIYNTDLEVIGRVPKDYFVFFRSKGESFFEDLDIDNLNRMRKEKIPFELLSADYKTNKLKAIPGESIAYVKFIDDKITVPFTNHPFDSDGMFVFKSISSIVNSD